MRADEQAAGFGEAEAIYRPSPGQTTAGVAVGAGAAGLLFAAATFGFGLDVTNRVCAVLLGAAAAGLTVWIYRQRRWRLVIFRGGLVQMRAGGEDRVAWEEVRELVQTRLKGFGDRTVRVAVVGSTCRLLVNPINYRGRAKLFETLLAAAERRGIPIRVEWEEVD